MPRVVFAQTAMKRATSTTAAALEEEENDDEEEAVGPLAEVPVPVLPLLL